MRHVAIPILFGASLLCGCDPSSTTQPATPATLKTPTTQEASEPTDYQLFLADTGLDVPASVEVVNYSSGWDERHLIVRMPRLAVEAFVARLPVQPVFTKPDMDGMAGEGSASIGLFPLDGKRPNWWRPGNIKSAQYFEGQFEWKTGATGRVHVLVEDADPARVLVWVMKT